MSLQILSFLFARCMQLNSYRLVDADNYNDWRDECLCGPFKYDPSGCDLKLYFRQGCFRVYYIYNAYRQRHLLGIKIGELYKQARYDYRLPWHVLRYSYLRMTAWIYIDEVGWPPE